MPPCLLREDWPDEEIVLYGPDTDSGTFDYFTEAIVGEEDASRDDYTASADDNVLVVGVEGDAGSLGYFGFAYYEESSDRLGAVAVDNGEGCAVPALTSASLSIRSAADALDLLLDADRLKAGLRF